MNTLVQASGLGYAASGESIVSDVELSVGSGELVVVIGPNGAGKSTLLRLLAGDLAPTDGTASIGGEPVASMRLGDLALVRAYLPEHTRREVPFTVRQVVAMARYPHRLRPDNTSADDAAAVDDALGATDATDLADRVYAELSAGEAQRVDIARILAQDTPVVLLDEPIAALDIGHEALVMGRLRTLAAGRRAVVAVLHDLNVAAIHADRIVLLDSGRVAASGLPGRVLSEELLSTVYRHPVRVTEHPFRDAPLVIPEQND